MPELPEVETILRDLQRKIVSLRIEDVIVVDGRVIRNLSAKHFVGRLKGQRVASITRRGKALILQLHPGKDYFVVQLMMTGQLIVSSDSQGGRQTKIIFKLSNARYLHYNDQRLFGRLTVVRDLNAIPYLTILGPEPFSRQFSRAYLEETLRYRKGPIKTLLLDHRVVAGIGNIYASEILYDCRINPCSPANKLGEEARAALRASTRKILRCAIKARGTSMNTYRDAEGRQGGFIKKLKVYGREQQGCFRCGDSIRKIVLSGRSTFFCPACQK